MTPSAARDRVLFATLSIVLLVFVPAPGAAATQAAAAAADTSTTALSSLDAFIESAMKDWRVPGMSLAIVRDGDVVLARGYGLRTTGKTDPVDGDTIFAIGSSSKAFTGACVGLLVDQKKVGWDDPVTKHLPWFALHDAYATRDLTVRDLLTHRSGIARADQLWYGSGFDRAEILHRFREVEPSWGFRERFGYQNIMFLAAGELYAAVAGESWDDCVARRFFAPLHMARSSTTVDSLPQIENVATPHEEVEGKVVTVPWRDLDNVAPAGSINSSAREMAEWVKLQLGDGPEILSAATLAETHTPQMVVRKEGSWANYFPASTLITYGLGWFVDDYRGEIVVEHGGSIDGMRALVSMIPEKKIGLVALTNRGGQLLPEVVRYRVYDTLLGLEPEDWNAQMLAAVETLRGDERKEREKVEAQRVAGTKPSLETPAYAGVYTHPAYGDATIEVANGALLLRRGEGVADLEHWHYDTFQAKFRNPRLGTMLVTFDLDATGKPAELVLPGLGAYSASTKSADRQ
jgi:CubicO group peptidase (beta-lactamase class C family)